MKDLVKHVWFLFGQSIPASKIAQANVLITPLGRKNECKLAMCCRNNSSLTSDDRMWLYVIATDTSCAVATMVHHVVVMVLTTAVTHGVEAVLLHTLYVLLCRTLFMTDLSRHHCNVTDCHKQGIWPQFENAQSLQ